MNKVEMRRRPAERRESGEHGVLRERRSGERRAGERRSGKMSPLQSDRRSGQDRRQSDPRRIDQRRSGKDRRLVPERLNRVSAILLPPVLHSRAVEDDSDRRAEADPTDPDTRASLLDSL